MRGSCSLGPALALMGTMVALFTIHRFSQAEGGVGPRPSTSDSARSSPTIASATNRSTLPPPPQSTASQFVASFSVPIVRGRNPPECGVQPNLTDIDPYKGCPLPGLNNLLYSQTNRWYCAFEQGFTAHLRDRTCDKGSVTPFRFSTVLQVDIEGLAQRRSDRGRGNGALCWSDIKKQIEPPKCTWNDIPYFYGRPKWWEARRLIDFHSIYYEAARQYAAAHFSGEPFIAVHLRRGDYFTHCVRVQQKRTPPWVSFATTAIPSLADRDPRRSAALKTDHNGNPHRVHSNCYPTKAEVVDHLLNIRNQTGIRHVFLATNVPSEFADLATTLGVQTFSSSTDRFRLHTKRAMDTVIVEMAVASLASYFVLNRYSSFSGSIFEMATIHNRTFTRREVDGTDLYRNVVTW